MNFASCRRHTIRGVLTQITSTQLFESSFINPLMFLGHLTALLNPSTQFTQGFIATTSDGRTICCNFNSSRGCTFHNCAYEHVCNRRATGRKACGLNHPGYSHASQFATQQQTTATQQQIKPTTQN